MIGDTNGELIGRLLLATSGCYDQGDGVDPPLSELYFPTGLALSAGATRLYAISSDFDLQYNAGALHALDLVRIRALVPKECGSDATTGWRDGEEIDYASVDLPDGYRDEASGDDVPPSRTRTWIAVTALVVAAAIVAAIVMGRW